MCREPLDAGTSRITCEFVGLNSPCISSIPVRKHFLALVFHPQGNSSSVAFFLSCSEKHRRILSPQVSRPTSLNTFPGSVCQAVWGSLQWLTLQPLEGARMRNPISSDISHPEIPDVSVHMQMHLHSSGIAGCSRAPAAPFPG